MSAPAPAPREPLSAVLAKDATATTMDAAFGSLFSLWGTEYRPGSGLACEQAIAQGLSCVWQRGSFAQLRLINRPAILSLVDAQGAAHQVVLSGLGGLCGLVLGYALCGLLRVAVPGLPIETPLAFAAAGLGLSLATGILSGLAPARRAAHLDPIEALRAE